MSTIRFYSGDESDLEGLTRDEVDGMCHEFYGAVEDAYAEMLGDVYGTVSVCGYDYDAGDALRRLDPIAFRCGVSDSTTEVDLDDYPVEAES